MLSRNYVERPGGDGATLIHYAAAAAEEVSESTPYLRDPRISRSRLCITLFRFFPTLIMGFFLSFFLLTIFSLGSL